MSVTINDLTINFANIEKSTLLDDWKWLIAPIKVRPVLITVMGDIFVQSSDGKIYFLDVVSGSIEEVANDGDEFRGLLVQNDFVTEKMFPARFVEIKRTGLILDDNEVYSYKKPLVLGGEDIISNIEKLNIDVHLSINGQIHEKIKDLPPGTPINNITIN